MKTGSYRKTGTRRISHIALMRMRVAAAESRLKEAKEHLSSAKRRRKLARLLAKRAKKDAKQAKANLAEVRTALAEIEARAATNVQRMLRRKTAGAKTAPSAAARKNPRAGKARTRHRGRRATAISKNGPTSVRGASESVASPTNSIASPSAETPIAP